MIKFYLTQDKKPKKPKPKHFESNMQVIANLQGNLQNNYNGIYSLSSAKFRITKKE